jgi:hypothetical protein
MPRQPNISHHVLRVFFFVNQFLFALIHRRGKVLTETLPSTGLFRYSLQRERSYRNGASIGHIYHNINMGTQRKDFV